ncbi:uncharacterized protein BT62DRAFT_1008279 [Guyanagaster necrorhizus]|uniref:Uncharacterized protein n=1 Tax=Guyanagaster necrorhizus TaxID=856835 RepID=A0A9P7VQD0_9AGAR|nr:uncharacterized protein BT62DRAFT_1008279 [Guyanagaster necrorhizus MCA 3950]KAG7444074.1 hypothetical protein BT62DRAFT_1008279 [Guyanagaster necrorhizus MCA 3950]
MFCSRFLTLPFIEPIPPNPLMPRNRYALTLHIVDHGLISNQRYSYRGSDESLEVELNRTCDETRFEGGQRVFSPYSELSEAPRSCLASLVRWVSMLGPSLPKMTPGPNRHRSSFFTYLVSREMPYQRRQASKLDCTILTCTYAFAPFRSHCRSEQELLGPKTPVRKRKHGKSRFSLCKARRSLQYLVQTGNGLFPAKLAHSCIYDSGTINRQNTLPNVHESRFMFTRPGPSGR